jgi:hypothetical protein
VFNQLFKYIEYNEREDESMLVKAYQGWKNYETWTVNTWMIKNTDSLAYWINKARAICFDYVNADTGRITKREKIISVLAGSIEDAHKDYIYDVTNDKSFERDMALAGLEHVSWLEIAESILDKAVED